MFRIGTGDDHFTAAQFEGHLAAHRHTQGLPDSLGQGDLAFGREGSLFMDAFMDTRHGRSPVGDTHACRVRIIPYTVNSTSSEVVTNRRLAGPRRGWRESAP